MWACAAAHASFLYVAYIQAGIKIKLILHFSDSCFISKTESMAD